MSSYSWRLCTGAFCRKPEDWGNSLQIGSLFMFIHVYPAGKKFSRSRAKEIRNRPHRCRALHGRHHLQPLTSFTSQSFAKMKKNWRLFWTTHYTLLELWDFCYIHLFYFMLSTLMLSLIWSCFQSVPFNLQSKARQLPEFVPFSRQGMQAACIFWLSLAQWSSAIARKCLPECVAFTMCLLHGITGCLD